MREEIVAVDGISVHYKIVGSDPPSPEASADKPAILILHGWGRGSDSYAEVMGKIAEQGYCLVVPDLPGFGKTNPPQTAWGVDEYENFVFQFAKSLGLEKFVLLGHSFGGQVALKFAVLHPALLQSLILYGAAVIRREPGMKTKMIRYIAKAGNMMFSPWPLSMIQGLARKALYRMLGNKDEQYSRGIMKQVGEKILRQDLSLFLSEVKVPTYIIWGVQDDKTPLQDAYILKEKIPGSFLKVVPNAGHRIHQEAPEVFINSITSFLRPQK